jgi:choline/glycine/proline betaine transport protein
MLFVCFYFMCSRHGSIRLGDDESPPEFSNFSQFTMLFSARVRIGLLFFGLAQPIFYFDTSAAWGYPNISYADPVGITMDLGVAAMRVTYFHMGFLDWTVYTMAGLCWAYFGFRKKRPLTLRLTLYPVIGERVYGPIGHAVDLPAEFGTVFGVATSLGLGVARWRWD